MVISCTSVSEAIEKIRGGLQYNLALIDLTFDERYVIGGMHHIYSGWDVIKESQSKNPSIPVVLITGYDRPPNWVGYYWKKSSRSIDDLLRIVNDHLDYNIQIQEIK